MCSEARLVPFGIFTSGTLRPADIATLFLLGTVAAICRWASELHHS